MKKGLTELVFIIDRSGSMAGLESDTIGGFNSTLSQHKKASGDAVVSTVLFDHESIVLHDRIPIKDVQLLSSAEYEVRGCTALLDAVGGSVRHIERVQKYLPEEYRPERVIFVITTDGMENASTRFSYDRVRNMIERKKKDGWEFLFLGANIDAVGEAARIGIAEDRAATYLADGEGNAIMHEAVAVATCSMRSMPLGVRMGSSWKSKVESDTAKRGRKSHPFKKR